MKAILDGGNFPQQNREIIIGGSKSVSNRLLILKSQFSNISIENLSESDDTQVLQNGVNTQKGTVDIHHAGTAMRFLTAYFAAKEGTEIILTGSPRMQERPIGILVNALKCLGADIEYLQKEGFPPLKIKGKVLRKKEVKIQADVSSQYISALMLLAPMLPNGIRILLEGKILSTPYIEMTLSLLNRIGIKAEFNKNVVDISPKKEIENTEIVVESDWTSASYFYSMVALSDDFQIALRNFSEVSLQGDSILPTIYKGLGVHTIFNKEENSISLSKTKNSLPESLLLDLSNTPDLAQTIAVSCFGLGIGCKLTGVQTLKIKETNRLAALKAELTKLGAQVQIDDTSFQLEKSTQIRPKVSIETYNDHRMAMAFAPLAIKTSVIIENAEVVSKSFPSFWKDIKKVGIYCKFED